LPGDPEPPVALGVEPAAVAADPPAPGAVALAPPCGVIAPPICAGSSPLHAANGASAINAAAPARLTTRAPIPRAARAIQEALGKEAVTIAW
jgi:hypothetical protein